MRALQSRLAEMPKNARTKADKRERFRRLLRVCADFNEFDLPMPSPLHPGSVTLTEIIVEKSVMLKSADNSLRGVILVLAFRTLPPRSEFDPPYTVVFKAGDDLRRDQMVLAMMEMMQAQVADAAGVPEASRGTGLSLVPPAEGYSDTDHAAAAAAAAVAAAMGTAETAETAGTAETAEASAVPSFADPRVVITPGDMRLTIYAVLATDVSGGLMEFIPNSATLQEVFDTGIEPYLRAEGKSRRDGGGGQQQSQQPQDPPTTSATLDAPASPAMLSPGSPLASAAARSSSASSSSLLSDAGGTAPFAGDYEAALYRTARMNMIASTAGYAVVGYILGFGDRHLENIMQISSPWHPATHGRVCHIDFNRLLGDEPKGKGKQPPMRLPSQLMNFIGESDFVHFVFSAVKFYTLLRPLHPAIRSLLLSMVDAGALPDDPKTLAAIDTAVTEKLRPELVGESGKAEAANHIYSVILRSSDRWKQALIDTIHKLKNP
jgi:hypothetical protein